MPGNELTPAVACVIREIVSPSHAKISLAGPSAESVDEDRRDGKKAIASSHDLFPATTSTTELRIPSDVRAYH